VELIVYMPARCSGVSTALGGGLKHSAPTGAEERRRGAGADRTGEEEKREEHETPPTSCTSSTHRSSMGG
jgi:hypothetical protein